MRLPNNLIFCALMFFAVVFLTGCYQQPSRHYVNFNNGELKILQFTDIHYKVASKQAVSTLERINGLLDIERPDLVVFTGDISLGTEVEKGWDEILEPLISRHIPWAAVLGNHDDEHTTSTRKQIMDYIGAKPYSLIGKDPKSVSGSGNYVIAIDKRKKVPAALIYMMDSNNYSTIEGLKGYGWFEFDQVDWYRNLSAHFTAQNGGKPIPALAFFHIPLQEYRQMAMQKDTVLIGNRKEKECCGGLNTGMYAAMLKAGDVMGTFVGHDHNNDYIGVLNGIALAYGRFSGSKITYSNIGYGARIIVLKDGQRAFDTWIRTSDGQKLFPVSYPCDLK